MKKARMNYCALTECGEPDCEANRDANVSHSIKCGPKYNFNKMVKKNTYVHYYSTDKCKTFFILIFKNIIS